MTVSSSSESRQKDDWWSTWWVFVKFTSEERLRKFDELIKVTVGLGWTRARASNPRVGQGWTHLICPRGLDGFGFLFDGLNRMIPSVRANWTDSGSCSTCWIGRAYLFVGHSTRILTHKKSRIEWSILELNDQSCSTGWAEQEILSDELTWVVNLVRARALG
jgi:hypothetical protein